MATGDHVCHCCGGDLSKCGKPGGSLLMIGQPEDDTDLTNWDVENLPGVIYADFSKYCHCGRERREWNDECHICSCKPVN